MTTASLTTASLTTAAHTAASLTRTTPPPQSNARLKQVRPTLWRVLRSDGSVAGYVEQVPDASPHDPRRYEARRLLPSTRHIVPIGDFATIDDALLCF